MQEDSQSELDREYRSFVRELHADSVQVVLEVESWWEPDVVRMATVGGHSDGGRDSEEAADGHEAEWRSRVYPRLKTLSIGHPDPDVRFAADILAKRLWSIILVISRPKRRDDRDDDRKDDETSVAIHLAHDGFARLRRAVYHAPFRVRRPEPTYEGVSVGNTEPLPGKMLETIEALQEAGVLERRNGLLGGPDIGYAVRQLSDILFLPPAERTALFSGSSVEDPVEPAEKPFRFGFAPADATPE